MPSLPGPLEASCLSGGFRIAQSPISADFVLRLGNAYGHALVAAAAQREHQAGGDRQAFVEEGGIEVEYNGVKSFIRRSDLARDRQDQRPERFQVGDTIDARVTNIDTKTRRLGLSIKAREIAEEKEAIDQYGSSDSGASLGDILGAALKSRG